MFRKIKELAGDSVIYGLSGIVTRFISIFLIPIYTRIFTPADYGIINLVSVTFLLMGIFVVIGLDNAAARWYWDKEDDKDRISTFSSWFWIQLLVSVLFAIVIALISPFLSNTILGDSNYYYLIILAAINLPFTAFTLVYSTWLRVRKKAINAVVFSLINSLLAIALSIYLVMYLRIGLKGVFLSQLIANIASAVIVVVLIGKNINIKHFRFDRLRQMLRYSVPLVPATISFWLLNSAGAYFISHYSTQTDVGLYQVGSSIAAVCNLIFWAFLQAWAPFAMSVLKQDDAPKIYSLVFDLYCSVGTVVVLSIFLFAQEILMLLTTEAYFNAAHVAGILSINIFISNITQVTSIGCVIVKTNKPYAVGVIAASTFTIIAYLVLIPALGKEGAAFSTLFGSLILSGYVTYRAQLLYFIPYKLKKNIVLIILMASIVTLSVFLPDWGIAINFIFKLLLLLIFLFFIFYSNKKGIIKLMTIKTQRVDNAA